ncbi:MAG: DUF2863 family protein [Betaproteobacteria bacterium]
MKRQRKPAGRMARDSERLVTLARHVNDSGSRLEERFWERELDALLAKSLRTGSAHAVETALDHLIATEERTYEILLNQCESVAESQVVTRAGTEYDLLLLAAPILAWTRYTIPSGALRAADVAVLQVHLSAHVLAKNARIMLAPFLFSLEQIPHSFAQAFALTSKLGTAALTGSVPQLNMTDATETEPLLADSRFLLAGVALPRGNPVFRWQEEADSPAAQVDRAQCLESWNAQARPNLASLLPSNGFEVLLPDAFYVSVQESDRRIRPYTIKASVAYLEGALTVEASQLRAVVAGVGENGIDEYRIGFTAVGGDAVVYGVVWPLYGHENSVAHAGTGSEAVPLDEIAALLKQCGIVDVHVFPGAHFPEYCEDCGAPFFPDPRADFVHAEPPAEDGSAGAHFH